MPTSSEIAVLFAPAAIVEVVQEALADAEAARLRAEFVRAVASGELASDAHTRLWRGHR